MFSPVRSFRALALGMLVLASPAGAFALPPQTISAARAAYLAADYEEALHLLADRDGSPDNEADVYRALCLLALNRTGELEQVLHALILRAPTYQLSSADVTPRLIAVFDDVRRRTLQPVIRRAYEEAKASFDAGLYAEASSRFDALLDVLGSAASVTDAATRDLGQLARTFKDRADAAAAASAASAARTAAANARAADEASIRGVVLEYADAFSALDADAVLRVFPSDNRRALLDAFSQLKAQRIEARNLNIAVANDSTQATVTLTWAVDATPKIGAPVRAQRKTTLRLARTRSGAWNIVERH